MILTNEVLIRASIFVLAVCGFFIARYIRRHKTQNTPLVCPIKFDCHTVVHSDYARFLGFPVEILGMFYYAFIAIVYLGLTISPDLMLIVGYDILSIGLLSLSLAGFLFSAYLIGIQIFIIKKGCSWCIVSAFVCLIIFILATFLYDFSFLI